MTAPLYDPPRGRNSYLAYVIACAIGIVLLGLRYAFDLGHSIRTGIVTVPIHIASTTEVPQPPAGATIRSAALSIRVRTADVPSGAITFVRVGDALEVILVALLIALVAAVAWKITSGSLFDPSTIRVLDVLVLAVFVTGLLPSFVRRMGWNWIVSGLGWGGPLPEPAVDVQWVPVYLGVLVVVCFRFALSAAQRMVRDQAGLV